MLSTMAALVLGWRRHAGDGPAATIAVLKRRCCRIVSAPGGSEVAWDRLCQTAPLALA